VLLVICAAGCKPATRLRIHFLHGFVPGSEHIFDVRKIALAPTAGKFAAGRFTVGAIYLPDGRVERYLYVRRLGSVVTGSVARALAGAGLKPIRLDAIPSDAKPPAGAEFILATEIEDVEANKRFGSEKTVHGQYFTMKSVIRLKFTLTSHTATVLYQGEMTGIEEEPPAPVGKEVFLPLETEPAESLSVAMSRAVGALMLQPRLQRLLTLRTAGGPPAQAAPTPSPTPGAAPNPPA